MRPARKPFRKEIVPQLRITDVVTCVSRYYGIGEATLLSRENVFDVSRPRQIAYALCYLLTPASAGTIARHFSGRARSTVVHAMATVLERAAQREQWRDDIAALRAQLGARPAKRAA
jgi:chromosomal replication initiator protein